MGTKEQRAILTALEAVRVVCAVLAAVCLVTVMV
jgi:hypothetical protein